MTTHEWLTSAVERLRSADIQTARLDALVLLEDTTGHDRAWLLAHPEAELNPQLLATLTNQLQKREQHTPLAYIRGKAEFYGRTFIVNEHVLVPRPESETMIDLLKQIRVSNPQIADIGTGSGALAITAALELPEAAIAAVDVDKACLNVARRNAVVYTTPVSFYNGDLLEPFLQKSCNFKPDILLCNLPYVPEDYPINDAAKQEPALALFSGPDGLDHFRKLFTQAKQPRPQYILTESLPEQHAELAKIAASSSYKLRTSDDFIQLFTAAS